MSKFCMMVGIPGSGKSYYAEKIARENDAKIFSSDSLREELFKDVNDQNNNEELFKVLHQRIINHIKSGGNAIYDATNISSNRRRVFLERLNKFDCERICVVMATPIEVCLKRNSTRDRSVPDDVIYRMRRNFNFPGKFEGFDKICIIHNDRSKTLYDYLNECKGFEQDNSHHRYDLFKHQYEVSRQISNHVISMAGLVHDIGKLYTKGYADRNGKETKEAHYYEHHNVGAYEAMQALRGIYDDEMTAYMCTLIQWHMQPYFMNSDKTRDKYKRIWGEELYNDIMILHEADEKAK